jgi:hypothetical protein
MTAVSDAEEDHVHWLLTYPPEGGKLLRIPPISLHPIAGLGRSQRWCDHFTRDAQLRQLPVENIAGRAGLITRPLQNSSQQTVKERLTICITELTVLRFPNRAAVLSGVEECLRQFGCPKHICDAL